MVMQIPTHEPESFRRGETVKWTKSLPDFSPDDSWTLTYYFVSHLGKQSKAATDNGDGSWAVTLAASDTEAFGAAEWAWQAVATLTGEVYVAAEGTFTVKEGFSTLDEGLDTRSRARRILDKLEQLIEDTAGSEQTSISVDGYSATFETKADLIAAWGHWKGRVRAEEDAEKLAAGLGTPAVVRVRF